MKRPSMILMFLAIAISAQVTTTTYADVTGDGSPHAFAAGICRAVQFQAPSGNSSTARVGDSNTTASRGELLPAGSGIYWPALPDNRNFRADDNLYSLANHSYYAANGDKITVVCFK